uniref:Uncharacterized protein n=1 Tax=Chelydra serpentina TaxID=8475 RepID=A0A8C3RTR1_CHESE
QGILNLGCLLLGFCVCHRGRRSHGFHGVPPPQRVPELPPQDSIMSIFSINHGQVTGRDFLGYFARDLRCVLLRMEVEN